MTSCVEKIDIVCIKREWEEGGRDLTRCRLAHVNIGTDFGSLMVFFPLNGVFHLLSKREETGRDEPGVGSRQSLAGNGNGRGV